MADDVKIVMFCCNWCSYGGADTAGTALDVTWVTAIMTQVTTN